MCNKKVWKVKIEVSFGKTKTVCIAFANDLVIFANNERQINQKIKILGNKLMSKFLQINAEKSVICHLVFSRKVHLLIISFITTVLVFSRPKTYKDVLKSVRKFKHPEIFNLNSFINFLKANIYVWLKKTFFIKLKRSLSRLITNKK